MSHLKINICTDREWSQNKYLYRLWVVWKLIFANICGSSQNKYLHIFVSRLKTNIYTDCEWSQVIKGGGEFCCGFSNFSFFQYEHQQYSIFEWKFYFGTYVYFRLRHWLCVKVKIQFRSGIFSTIQTIALRVAFRVTFISFLSYHSGG